MLALAINFTFLTNYNKGYENKNPEYLNSQDIFVRNSISADTTAPFINASYTSISDKVVSENVVIGSTHPYADSSNLTWTIKRPGVPFITMYFDRISTEYSYDYLKIYDKAWNLDYNYTGYNVVTNTKLTVNSDVVYIVLTSDVYVTDYGFSLSKLEHYEMKIVNNSNQELKILQNMYCVSANYSINEPNPAYYSIFQNNVLVDNGSYITNKSFSFTFNNLVNGINNFSIVAYDLSGNHALNSLFQTYYNLSLIQGPIYKTFPNNITLTESNKSSLLKWVINDLNATNYELWLNGIKLSSGNYNDSDEITYIINFDNVFLNVGENTLKFTAFDIFGKSTTITTIITKIQPKINLLLSSSSTETRTIPIAKSTKANASGFTVIESIFSLISALIIIQKIKIKNKKNF